MARSTKRLLSQNLNNRVTTSQMWMLFLWHIADGLTYFAISPIIHKAVSCTALDGLREFTFHAESIGSSEILAKGFLLCSSLTSETVAWL